MSTPAVEPSSTVLGPAEAVMVLVWVVSPPVVVVAVPSLPEPVPQATSPSNPRCSFLCACIERSSVRARAEAIAIDSDVGKELRMQPCVDASVSSSDMSTTQRPILLSLLVLAACGTTAEPAGDDGSGDTAAATSSESGGMTGGTGVAETGAVDSGSGDTESLPTGDLWVDAEGTIIGTYRVVVDDDGDSVEGLVQLDADVTWQVSTDHTSTSAIDAFGQVFYASSDCSGPAWVAEVPSFGSFRSGIVASAPLEFGDALTFVVPADAARVEETFASWIDWQYGCLDFDVGIYDNPPTSFLPEDALLLVEPPVFTPPLTIEHH